MIRLSKTLLSLDSLASLSGQRLLGRGAAPHNLARGAFRHDALVLAPTSCLLRRHCSSSSKEGRGTQEQGGGVRGAPMVGCLLVALLAGAAAAERKEAPEISANPKYPSTEVLSFEECMERLMKLPKSGDLIRAILLYQSGMEKAGLKTEIKIEYTKLLPAAIEYMEKVLKEAGEADKLSDYYNCDGFFNSRLIKRLSFSCHTRVEAAFDIASLALEEYSKDRRNRDDGVRQDTTGLLVHSPALFATGRPSSGCMLPQGAPVELSVHWLCDSKEDLHRVFCTICEVCRDLDKRGFHKAAAAMRKNTEECMHALEELQNREAQTP